MKKESYKSKLNKLCSEFFSEIKSLEPDSSLQESINYYVSAERKIYNLFELKIKDLEKNSVRCTNCKENFKIPKKLESKEFVRTETVYTDAGYGDDDKVADVTYIGEFATCPKCKEKVLIKKFWVRNDNERLG